MTHITDVDRTARPASAKQVAVRNSEQWPTTAVGGVTGLTVQCAVCKALAGVERRD
jgi:hypothetical protein